MHMMKRATEIKLNWIIFMAVDIFGLFIKKSYTKESIYNVSSANYFFNILL